METIEEKIDIYQYKLEELKSIKEEIERQYKEFKRFMKPQRDCLDEKKLDLSKYLNDNIIKIRLGDFIDILSSITNIERSNIKYCVKTNIYYTGNYKLKNNLNKDKKIKYSYASYPMVILSIFINDNEYTFNYKMDINEIQSDGRKMIEHCSAITTPDVNYLVGCRTDIVIDENVDDIIISFNLCDLTHMVNSNLVIDVLNKYNNKIKKLGGK